MRSIQGLYISFMLLSTVFDVLGSTSESASMIRDARRPNKDNLEFTLIYDGGQHDKVSLEESASSSNGGSRKEYGASEDGDLSRQELTAMAKHGNIKQILEAEKRKDAANRKRFEKKLRAMDQKNPDQAAVLAYKDAQVDENEESEMDEQTKEQTAEEDGQKLFKEADKDGSSFLEEREIVRLLKETNINPGKLRWQRFDADKDDRLSKDEFLRAGGIDSDVEEETYEEDVDDDPESSEENIVESSASLAEIDAALDGKNLSIPDSDEPGSSEADVTEPPAFAETDTAQAAKKLSGVEPVRLPSAEEFKRMQSQEKDSQIFKHLDSNADGYLQPSEIAPLLKRSGLEEFPWQEHDVDGDGQLSELEFVTAGPAAANHKERMPNREAENQVFQGADTDHSSFLEQKEIESFLDHVGLDSKYFNWRDHDKDHDGRLSEEEFFMAGPKARDAFLHAQTQRLKQDKDQYLSTGEMDRTEK
eukprot:gnl/MRDRNA2_/MRDRNA2_106847_c0_seq1.p1 gnl/MRDRNA2_/MRDRNA2_106847_c0~~gnl/MRDRNA2_/MRDRNA2_106847_c0_seq1.p1  ORF type:complete len:476 (+),score=156.11 gnl/MRDRNA2_/MRDRNA2_106847_c0_seq1:77-1504(+)